MIPDHLILIKSPIIQSVAIRENNEPMVDLASYAIERGSGLKCADGVRVRETVADKLVNAQEFLPAGRLLYVVEGYRSPAQQEALWNANRAAIKKQHADWTDQQLDEEASILFAPPGSVMPHATGAAVDVGLVDADGAGLDFGTGVNATAAETDKRTYTRAENITPEQKANRQTLIDAMNNGEFVNYATEWWHWSTGDQYWAFSTEQPFAVYGMVNE